MNTAARLEPLILFMAWAGAVTGAAITITFLPHYWPFAIGAAIYTLGFRFHPMRVLTLEDELRELLNGRS